jgi:release factor glutamine methyltransferase
LDIKTAINNASLLLREAGVESNRLDANILLCHLLGKSREYIFMKASEILEAGIIDKFNELIKRRVNKEPIAYIIGKKEFWGLDFIVNRDTLIPRPDSETIVQAVLDKAKAIAINSGKYLQLLDIKLADIGTGSGCIIISVIKNLPSASGIAVDINVNALKIAKENSLANGVSKQIEFIESNWLDNIDNKFDIIVSNPPYISQADFVDLMEDVKNYEPKIALVSGSDGMDSYRYIASQAKEKLVNNGFVILEIGQGQSEQVSDIFIKQGFVIEDIRNDLSGIARCIIAKYNNN